MNKTGKSTRKQLIIATNDEQNFVRVFQSAREAARFFGVNVTTITRSLHAGRLLKGYNLKHQAAEAEVAVEPKEYSEITTGSQKLSEYIRIDSEKDLILLKTREKEVYGFVLETAADGYDRAVLYFERSEESNYQSYSFVSSQVGQKHLIGVSENDIIYIVGGLRERGFDVEKVKSIHRDDVIVLSYSIKGWRV